MPKVVINRCIGQFGISEKAKRMLEQRTGRSFKWTEIFSLPRHNPDLIATVESLGQEVNTMRSQLKIVEIDSQEYRIVTYDNGLERVQTPKTMDWILVEN